MTLLQRLTSDGPKRILALDGGGIRGALTLGFLERVEQLLRIRHKRADLKLCDYFDLIGGTSTGAIIASALAIGKTASEIKQIYLDLGGKVFGKKKWKKWEALFDAEPLKEELARMFGDRTLGDPSIGTGLCIVAKRADTRSTWPLINHPGGRYYPKNKAILLRDAVRASTAAPVYFVPEKFDVGQGEMGAFVDGGVSMANNPALQFFLVATLKGFPFRWQTGEDRLLLVSVGTGVWQRRDDVDDVAEAKAWDWAKEVPSMLMEDASWQSQLLLQYLSRTLTPWEIDREIGDLASDLLTPEPALSYLRYNVWLGTHGLQELGLSDLVPKLDSLREMSAAENRYDLARIGEKAAERQVRDEHFPNAFDLPS
jgi:predicted acylesterase/phospholipase RssA